MKRNNHITINLSDDEMAYIKKLSLIYRRSISELCYLILVDNAKQLFIENQLKNGSYTPVIFTPSNKQLN